MRKGQFSTSILCLLMLFSMALPASAYTEYDETFIGEAIDGTTHWVSPLKNGSSYYYATITSKWNERRTTGPPRMLELISVLVKPMLWLQLQQEPLKKIPHRMESPITMSPLTPAIRPKMYSAITNIAPRCNPMVTITKETKLQQGDHMDILINHISILRHITPID